MGMTRRQYLPPKAEENFSTSVTDEKVDIDSECQTTIAMCAELEMTGVEKEVAETVPSQVTPRRLRRSTLGALSCASTECSGPPSPALESVQLTPYLGTTTEPVKAAELFAALENVSADDSGSHLLAETSGPKFEPKGVPTSFTEVPIFGEYEAQSRTGETVTRVKNTFIERHELDPACLRKSSSAPALESNFLAELSNTPVTTTLELHLNPAVTPTLQGRMPPSSVPPPPGTAPPSFQFETGNLPPPPPLHDLEPGLSVDTNIDDAQLEASAAWTSSQQTWACFYPQQILVQVPWVPGCSEAESGFVGYVEQSQTQESPETALYFPLQGTDGTQFSDQEAHLESAADEKQQCLQSMDVWYHDQHIAEDFVESEDFPVNFGEYSVNEWDCERGARQVSRRRSSQCSSITDANRGQKGKRKEPQGNWQGAHEITEAARANPETVWHSARKDKHSSADAQLAITTAARTGNWDDAWSMVLGFQNHVKEGYESAFANYVMQVMLQELPTECIRPIAQELEKCVVDAAKHRFGCRVVIRLVRYHADSDDHSVSAAIQRLCKSLKELAGHEYGTHVAQEIVEVVRPEYLRVAMTTFMGHLNALSKIRLPSKVVEKAFQYGDADTAQDMVTELVSNKEALRHLIDHEFGARVLKAAMTRTVEVNGIETIAACSRQVAQTIIELPVVFGKGGRYRDSVLKEAHVVVAM